MKSVSGSVFVVMGLLTVPSWAAAQSDHNSVECGQTYTVASGDSLSKISLKAYGQTAFSTLYEANIAVIGPDPNKIFVGQQLNVPCQSGSATAVAAADANAAPQPSATVQDTPTEPAAVVPATQTSSDDAAPLGEDLILTFNKTSAPKFIINSGIIDLYLAEITQVTNGRVQFIDPPTMNRDPRAQLDLVTSGSIDGTYVFNGHLSVSHPLLQLPMLPLMGGSAEQTAVSLWRLHAEYLAQTDYFDEAQLLGFVAAPAAHIWRLSDEPVPVNQNIAELNNYAVPYFEGLDTRGPAAVREENAMRLASYDEDQNGTLTFFMAHGAARAAGVWADDRTVTEVDNGLYTPTFSVILSNDAWGQISAQDREAIQAISGERLAARSASWDAFDNGHRQHMIDTGLNIVRAEAALLAELESGLAPHVGSWMEAANALGVPGSEAVNSYKGDLASLQNRLVFR